MKSAKNLINESDQVTLSKSIKLGDSSYAE